MRVRVQVIQRRCKSVCREICIQGMNLVYQVYTNKRIEDIKTPQELNQIKQKYERGLNVNSKVKRIVKEIKGSSLEIEEMVIKS